MGPVGWKPLWTFSDPFPPSPCADGYFFKCFMNAFLFSQKFKTVCHQISCPPATCANPSLVEGECCPSCFHCECVPRVPAARAPQFCPLFVRQAEGEGGRGGGCWSPLPAHAAWQLRQPEFRDCGPLVRTLSLAATVHRQNPDGGLSQSPPAGLTHLALLACQDEA